MKLKSVTHKFLIVKLLRSGLLCCGNQVVRVEANFESAVINQAGVDIVTVEAYLVWLYAVRFFFFKKFICVRLCQ